MSEDSPLKQLDQVLNILATHPEAFGNVSDGDIYKILTKEKIDVGNDLIHILNKLDRDLNVDSHIANDNIKRYAISFEGKILNRNGGYTETERRKTKEANLQSSLTWAIAVGTLLAGLYGLVQMTLAILQFGYHPTICF